LRFSVEYLSANDLKLSFDKEKFVKKKLFKSLDLSGKNSIGMKEKMTKNAFIS